MPLPRDWFRRYVWRRDVGRKVVLRARDARRRLTRSDLDDLERLFGHRSVEVVLDVGANIGVETDRFLRAWPQATVHAFEPAPAALRRLRDAYADHPRVEIHGAAVSDHAGEAELRVDDRTFAGGANSLLPHGRRFLDDQPQAAYASVTVPTVRLDDLGLDHVDVLKLDVEGAELLALDGAADLLAGSAIDAIDLEVRALPDFDGQPLLEDILAHLRPLGYRLFNLYELAEAPLGQLLWANAVVLSEPFRQELTARHGTSETRF